MKIVVLLAALALLGSAAHAQPSRARPPARPTRPVAVETLGIGTESCVRWTEHARDRNWRNIEEAWLGGFVSGVNATRRFGNVTATVHDFAGMASWIDVYCAQNPLSSVGHAAERLVAELVRRRAHPR